MKRALLHGLLAATILGVAVVGAQNINRSLQLNQSAVGSFGVDSSNNAFWPAHMNVGPVTTAPTIGGAGTGTTVSGSDFAGSITFFGTNIQPSIMTFRNAYTGTPYCNVTLQRGTPISYHVTPAGIQITPQTSFATGVDIVHYQCVGRGTG